MYFRDTKIIIDFFIFFISENKTYKATKGCFILNKNLVLQQINVGVNWFIYDFSFCSFNIRKFYIPMFVHPIYATCLKRITEQRFIAVRTFGNSKCYGKRSKVKKSSCSDIFGLTMWTLSGEKLRTKGSNC